MAASASALHAHIDALWPDGSSKPPAVQLRRSIALWLAGNPQPDVGPFTALLSTLGQHLRSNPLWLNPEHNWPKPKVFLLDPESLGVFKLQQVQDLVVRLDVAALRALAGPPLPPPSRPPPSSSSPSAAAGPPPHVMTTAAVMSQQDLKRTVRCAFVAYVAGQLTNPATQLRRVIALWLADSPSPEIGRPYAALLSSVGEHLSSRHSGLWLNPEYKWPKLKPFLLDPDSGGAFRCIARSGHGGDAIAELDLTALRAMAKASLALLPPPSRPSLSPQARASPVPAAPHSGSASEAAAAAAVAARPLHVIARMVFPAFTDGQRVGDPASNLRRAIAVWLARPGVGPHRVLMSQLGHYLRLNHADLWLNPAYKWPRLKPFLLSPDSMGAFKCQPLGAGDGEGLVELDEVALRSLVWRSVGAARASTTLLPLPPRPSSTPLTGVPVQAASQSGSASEVAAAAVGQVARIAFPAIITGQRVADPAAALRRVIVLWLADSPRPDIGPHIAPLAVLGQYLRTDHADVWLNPAHKWPKLKTFLLESDSKSVFRCYSRDDSCGDAVVELDDAALRSLAAEAAEAGALRKAAAAARGTTAALVETLKGEMTAGLTGPSPEPRLAAAVAAAWPGDDALSRIRRRAALLLAAVEGPGPDGHCHAMLRAQTAATLRKLEAAAVAEVEAATSRSKSVWQQLAGDSNGDGGGPEPLLRCTQVRGKHDGIFVLDLETLMRKYGGGGGGGGGAGSGGGSVASGALPSAQQELAVALERRFPTAASAGGGGIAAYELDGRPEDQASAVKRCVAQLLAETTPPHELAFAHLGAQVPKLLGGKRANLRTLCLEEPGVFEVTLQGKSHYVVRLVCPELLRLATAATAALASTAPAVAPRPAAVAVLAAGAVPAGDDGSPTQPVAARSPAAAHPLPIPVPLPVRESSAASSPTTPLEPGAWPEQAAVQGAALAGHEAAAGAAALPAAEPYIVSDPYGPELLAMLQHCHACSHVGLAVQVYGNRPTLVTLYALPALMRVDGGSGGGGEGDNTVVSWPAAVYLVDPMVAAGDTYGGGGDGEAAGGALLIGLRGLLEDPGVAKVVHGGGAAVACLEAAIAAADGGGAVATSPLLDTRVVLTGIEAMLGLPHTPPPATPLLAPGYGAVLGCTGMAVLRSLHAHVSRLRDCLSATGLWAGRPQLLAALTSRHFSALRDGLRGSEASGSGSAEGGGGEGSAAVLSRPLTASQVAVAAGAARHLPELWAGLVEEAVPWVAVHSAARAMEPWREEAAVAQMQS